MKLKSKTTQSKEVHELSSEEIIKALRACNYAIPENAVLFVRVPGGGDWSNCDLEIDAYAPLNVRWESKTEEGGE